MLDDHPFIVTASARLEDHVPSRAPTGLWSPFAKHQKKNPIACICTWTAPWLEEAGVLYVLPAGTRHSLFVAEVLNETRHVFRQTFNDALEGDSDRRRLLV